MMWHDPQKLGVLVTWTDVNVKISANARRSATVDPVTRIGGMTIRPRIPREEVGDPGLPARSRGVSDARRGGARPRRWSRQEIEPEEARPTIRQIRPDVFSCTSSLTIAAMERLRRVCGSTWAESSEWVTGRPRGARAGVLGLER